MFKVIIIAHTMLFCVYSHATNYADIRDYFTQGIVKANYMAAQNPQSVKAIGKDHNIYSLNFEQLENAYRKALNLPSHYIINGNGMSVLIPVEDRTIMESYAAQYDFCYNEFDGLSLYSSPHLQLKNEHTYYAYCDITPLVSMHLYNSVEIEGLSEFSVRQLLAAWRNLTSKGDMELYHSSILSNTYLYKKPSFFFNNKQYPIKASKDFQSGDNTSAQGYCMLKKNQYFVERFGKDSVIELRNQEVVILDEYGAPNAIEFHAKVLVWNAILCSNSD